jgi:hypothetical protein
VPFVMQSSAPSFIVEIDPPHSPSGPLGGSGARGRGIDPVSQTTVIVPVESSAPKLPATSNPMEMKRGA